MRILIVNDDGVNATGLGVAEDIAAELAGTSGEIWVVAPETERSAASHCISYTRPMRVMRLGERRFAIDGYPADCVIAGLVELMPAPPDLVISGVNRGHNVAEDTVYSGTVAGAMEGALHGIKSVALSQYFSAAAHAPEDMSAPARARGAETVRRILDMPWRADMFYNVNFPAYEPEAIRGLVLAPQGRRRGGAFECVETISPSRRRFFWLAHSGRETQAAEHEDSAMASAGWITATPMRPDITDHEMLEAARAALRAAE